ncbi:PREDICTED: prenylcysteine oxidase-like isoform X2 [Mandrillus leucophaeus]|uniref:prenylcysteine oxidase-like isoform X2 n=1 Tax=Colobus angolensis palliatus TaxID=336983 RepID=UPI0005F39EEB|nr:PREDICTED: prenylcysteine oxidase-like isoform X2 [Colobus angolensis palliatus]XP_011840777.1 PREDICTED: prenylcysteine oxidase-like isoform X2 [Mandrillus leucophaeus]
MKFKHLGTTSAGGYSVNCSLSLSCSVSLLPYLPGLLTAVVGAGIGGSAVAHFLQQHFGPRVQIDVYEKGTVGGRLATISVNKQHYESGAASFHSLSLHMQDFVKLLGLRHRREVVGRSAIFGGEHFVLEETDWYLLNLFRLWWHYGISFLRLQMWVEEVMEKFMSYGQSAAMPAFAGAMSLAGAQGSLWSVEGGNKLVCSGLLKLTKANVIHATVTSVTLHSTEGKALYQVAYENEVGNSSDFYDIVVIATPLHLDNSSSNLTFAGFHPPIDDLQGSFQPTVVSLVHGYLNSSYFGFPDPKLFPFANILTTDFPSFFCTLDNICPVNISASFRRKQPQEAAVWRVQSPKPLFRTQLKTLFRSYYSVQTAEWQAHPLYGSRPTLPRFALHDQLFYLNALEWAASSVEVMAVAAKNVALLAYNRWYQDLDKIDQKDLMHKVKTEL